MIEPTNRILTCVACGEPILENQGEIPCVIEPTDREEFGTYEGEAYHLNKCEDKIFDEVWMQV